MRNHIESQIHRFLEPGFSQHIPFVIFDGMLTDKQFRGNFGIGHMFAEQAQNFHFPRGQRRFTLLNRNTARFRIISAAGHNDLNNLHKKLKLLLL